ncbi:MAG TPA: transporter substrate-binding domain-containing protein [Oligoflexus sp.]|uniref:substrate-binding periplasmic protein n=1 Tax=Oligoflexus sp. TaxID=1971216 RepID=UPI002D43D15F|nr:transporter substrate-binding domain-containing protein [Oligoflexus sp.]HYX37710.1 transporter substrate-binding domain-containing protein [Oligoflexus sp.]
MSNILQKPVSALLRRVMITFVTMLGALPAPAKDRPLKVGLIEFGPLVVYNSNQAGGLLIDYARPILEQAGMPLIFQNLSIDRSLEELKNNQLDLVLTLFKTPERERWVQFSRQPLLTVANGFCTESDIELRPLTAESRLAHVRGTVVPPALQFLKRVPVSGDKAQIRMVQMLSKKRVEAIYSPKPEILMFVAHEAGLGQSLFCYELRKSRIAIHIGFSKDLPASTIQKIEESLERKIQDEAFDDYLGKRLQSIGAKKPVLKEFDPDIR